VNRYQPLPGTTGTTRLTYEELVRRRKEMLAKREADMSQAGRVGSSLTEAGLGIDDVVTTADTIGEGFRCKLRSDVTMTRHKSALLSLLEAPVELKRLSVYNPDVHPRFPLKSVRLKNSTGQHLMQGPVAVFDEGAYVGDSRMLDLEAGQERLLSYAVDLGLEVRPEVGASTARVVKQEVVGGVLWVNWRHTRRTTYRLHNRSRSERIVVVEHAIKPLWLLTEDTEKPVESTRSLHRFQWKVAAGEAVRRSVVETRQERVSVDLLTAPDRFLHEALANVGPNKAVKEALGKVLAARERLEVLRREAVKLADQLREHKEEQQRLRTNLSTTSAGSAADKRFARKLENVETQIESAQAQLAEKKAAQTRENEALAAYLKRLSVK
jgi:hypothetical protein